MATNEERLAASAAWLRANKDKANTPEFKRVADVYKTLRQPQPVKPAAQQATPAPNGQEAPLWVQAGSGVMEGIAGLPGLPVELASWAKGVPVEESNLQGWGAKGWQDFAERNIGKIHAPEPKTEVERATRKLGNFMGGGAVAGPAAMVPSLTGFIGSEVGRKTDESGITGGYGEVVGGIAGAVVPGLARGQVTAGLKPDAPTNETLREIATRAYKQAEDAGVIINQSGLNRVAHGIRSDLGRLAFRPKLQPNVAATLDEIDTSLQAGNITLQDVESIRRVATTAIRGSINPAEKEMLGRIVERLDDFVDDIKPHEMVAGDAQVASAALKEARNHWKRLRKSEMIDEAVGNAELRASSTGSGGNTDNAIRQNIRAILTNKKKRAQFTKEEQQLMLRVAKGSVSHNALRLVGSLSPDKGMFPLMATSAIGGGVATGGLSPLALAVPVAGAIARRGAEALTKRNVAQLSERVRLGSSAQEQAGSQAARIAAEVKRRAALAANSAKKVTPSAVNYRSPERKRIDAYRP